MPDGRELQIFRDGRRHTSHRIQLPTGAQATYETLRHMARIVREDAAFPDNANWALRDVLRGNATLDAAFEFCRDQIHYLPERDGYETLADLWSCLYHLHPTKAVGDCAIKSVALATLLCYLKFKPFFRALRQTPGVDFYSHVFVGVRTDDGVRMLDPTPPQFRPGDTMRGFGHVDLYIFR